MVPRQGSPQTPLRGRGLWLGTAAVLAFAACTHGSLDLPGPTGTATGTPTADSSPTPGGTPPVLVALSPTSGKVGLSVTATGRGFRPDPAGCGITVEGAPAAVSAWTDTRIVFTIPKAAFPGDRQVVVTTPGGASGSQPLSIVLPPSLYVQAHNGITADTTHDYIFGFAIAANGTLTPIAGSPWSVGDAPETWTGDAHSMVVDAARRRLYASGLSTLAPFAIDGSSGALTLGSLFPLGDAGNGTVALSPDASKVFVVNCNSQEINVVAVAGDGTLSAIAGSPFATGLGSTACADGAALTPDGAFLYVGSELATFGGFSVAASGALTALNGSPFALQGGKFSGNPRLSPSGSTLVVPDNGMGQLFVYSIGANGVPTSASKAPAIQGANGAAFSPDGTHFYLGSLSTGTVNAYDVSGSNLSPAAFNPATTATDVSNAMALTSDGRFFYLLDGQAAQVRPFSLAANGSLTSIQTAVSISGTQATQTNQLASILVVP